MTLFFLRRCCFYLLLSTTTTIAAFYKGGSILAFIVHVYERALLACGFCHLRYIYNLKEKSESLFNLYVWFYFLCVIKRKIVAAITYNNQTKIQWRIDHVACTVRLFVCSLAQTFASVQEYTYTPTERPSVIYTIRFCFVCALAMGNSIVSHVRAATNTPTEGEKRDEEERLNEERKNERMKESKPSRRWHTMDGVFHPSMNQNE